MPFEELPHTADWALRVWAEDLPGLFAEAARGMNALAGARPAAGPAVQRSLSLSAVDVESLLVAFLSELVYAAEQEGVVFTNFQLGILESADGWRLQAGMQGAPLATVNKMIKAVTYHNLQIRHTEQGYETEVVFDV